MSVFGYHTAGTAGNDDLEDDIKGSLFTAPETGTIPALGMCVTVAGSAGHPVKGAVYKHSDLSLVGYTEEITVNNGASQWVVADANGTISVTAGTEYLLVAWADDVVGTCHLQYDAGDVNQGHHDAQVYNGFPDPFVLTAHNNNKYSIYAHYTPSSPTTATADSFDKPAAITHGHAYCYDGETITGWTEYVHRMTPANATPTSEDGDILQIAALTDDAGEIEFCYYEFDNTDFPTSTYGELHMKYRTSTNSNAIEPRLQLLFSDGSAQTIHFSYSTTLIVRKASITPGKSLEKIRLYAYSPATAPTTTYYIYVDWLMMHKGTFEFPNVRPGGVFPRFHENVAKLSVPGRHGPIRQRLGMDDLAIIIRGEMQSGETWGSISSRYGDYFMDIIRGMNEVTDTREPFQYLFTDLGNFQVILESFEPTQDSETHAMRGYTLTFAITKLSDLGLAWWHQRGWYGEQP